MAAVAVYGTYVYGVYNVGLCRHLSAHIVVRDTGKQGELKQRPTKCARGEGYILASATASASARIETSQVTDDSFAHILEQKSVGVPRLGGRMGVLKGAFQAW